MYSFHYCKLLLYSLSASLKVFLTLSALVTCFSYSLITISVPPIFKLGFLYIISLAFASLAERCNSVAPVSDAIRAILLSLTPLPGIIIILLLALVISSLIRLIPCSALGCCPDVKILSHPKSIILSRLSKGSLHMSKALWKVTPMPFAASISSLFLTISTAPSGVRQPNTTPSIPNLPAISISFSIILCSRSVYIRSEEHTSELQSRPHLVCRLLLE